MNSAIAHHQPVPEQCLSPWPTSPVVLLSKIPYGNPFEPAVLDLFPTALWASPTSSPVGQYEKMKHPPLSVSTTQQQWKHWGAINIIFNPNSKQCAIRLGRKLTPFQLKLRKPLSHWNVHPRQPMRSLKDTQEVDIQAHVPRWGILQSQEISLESSLFSTLLNAVRTPAFFKETLATTNTYAPTTVLKSPWKVFPEHFWRQTVYCWNSSFCHHFLTWLSSLPDGWPLVFSSHLIATGSEDKEITYVFQNWGLHQENSAFVK